MKLEELVTAVDSEQKLGVADQKLWQSWRKIITQHYQPFVYTVTNNVRKGEESPGYMMQLIEKGEERACHTIMSAATLNEKS